MDLLGSEPVRIVAGAALFLAGSFAMQTVLLWRWRRRLDAGEYDEALARALANAVPGLVDTLSATLADRLRMAVLGARGGAASAASRQADAMQADLAEAALGEAGLDLSDVAKQIDPALAKFLRKNPQVAAFVGQVVQARVAKALGGVGGSNGQGYAAVEMV